MCVHEQRDTQQIINIIFAGNGLTLKQPVLLPQNLSPQTGREKEGRTDRETQDKMKGGHHETGESELSECCGGVYGEQSSQNWRKPVKRKKKPSSVEEGKWWKEGMVM